jgi:hypothetical protein
MSELRYDSQNWLQQAEAARRLVRHMGEPYTKLQMLLIAEAYSHLAEHSLHQAEMKAKSGTAGQC